ncbi:cationic amino acid transporter 1 [Cajanus cajan]|uniref:High affinity cationic amino acid transporter 1 n=1 Tax=Cajanus cajan TaxID=3821 RepID=A0A151RWP8_CAJCA|nr:cationic amino acid transporter 1 [Cajanus cajan]KYP46966.1 High affinity cationic amino acid transporter 1 [Cajanus cajan]
MEGKDNNTSSYTVNNVVAEADEAIKLESFASVSKYGRAVLETPLRLVDRVTSRSMDEVELVEVKRRSQHEMKKTLTWWDLIWFGLGSVIGSGIFVLTGFEVKSHVGPAVVLSYVISGISAMLSVFCYTEFAVEIPVAGGSFAYLRVELGDFVAYIASGNILLEYVVGGAAVARSWTSYFATLCNQPSDKFLIHAHRLSQDYSHLDLIAVLVLAIVGLFAVFSTKGSSRFNYVASIIHVIVLLFIIVAGLTKAQARNYTDDFLPFGPRGIFQAAAVLFFAYVGFDAVSTMAEETKNPGRDIPLGLIGSMTCVTFLYCMLSVTLCLMQRYSDVDENAAFSVAFEAVGMSWAKYIVAFGALKGMTSVLLVGAVGQARYLTHIARTHLLPPWFARVNEKTGTPINATITMLGATAVVAFFTSLDVLANLLSISTLFLFSLVALALLVRRYNVRGVTTRVNVVKFVVCVVLILGSSVASAVYWANTEKWVGYTVFVPIWFVGTVGIWMLVPLAKKPKVWGVPLVPFLPSASIGINVFLLGSLDKASFRRFGVWTGILLVYYLFVGLHASYDMARLQKKERLETKTESTVDEEDGVVTVTESITKSEKSYAAGV